MFFIRTDEVPHDEIDRCIEWLETVKGDCAYRISELKKIKSNNSRHMRYKHRMNNLAMQVYKSDTEVFESGDRQARINYIKEYLDCSGQRAELINETLRLWSNRQKSKDRDKLIIALANQGMKKTEIAKHCGVSRPTVYAALRKISEK